MVIAFLCILQSVVFAVLFFVVVVVIVVFCCGVFCFVFPQFVSPYFHIFHSVVLIAKVIPATKGKAD